MTPEDIVRVQKDVCNRYGKQYVASPPNMKVGISRDIKSIPINGQRHPLEGDTTGWYIWTGDDFSDDPDYFLPIHTSHLEVVLPSVLKYLGLPPGWRFLIDDTYEDVWYDPTLLEIED